MTYMALQLVSHLSHLLWQGIILVLKLMGVCCVLSFVALASLILKEGLETLRERRQKRQEKARQRYTAKIRRERLLMRLADANSIYWYLNTNQVSWLPPEYCTERDKVGAAEFILRVAAYACPNNKADYILEEIGNDICAITPELTRNLEYLIGKKVDFCQAYAVDPTTVIWTTSKSQSLM